MQPEMVVSSRLVMAHAMLFASLGLDPAVLRAELGVDLQDAGRLGDWVPFEVAVRLWQAARRLSPDPMLGVAVGERVPLGALGLVFHSANASDDLGGALRRFTRYSRLVSTPLRTSLDVGEEVARLQIGQASAARGVVPAALREAILTVILRIARSVTGGAVRVHELAFAHAAPAPAAEYERRLGAPVRFEAAASSIAFAAADLALPVPTADPTVLAAIEAAAERAELPSVSATARVRSVLRGLLEQGPPRIEAAALALRTSPRSLQRRLAEEGTSFAELVDRRRRELALGAIARPELGLVEVAFLAGFAEPSAFFRAFRRWTGSTPAEYRRRAPAAAL